MAYRPYPDTDRALRQLHRHPQPEPVVSELWLRLAKQADLTLEAAAVAFRPTFDAIRTTQVPPPTKLAVALSKMRRYA